MMRIAIDARFYGTEHTGLGRYTTNVLSHLPTHLKTHTLYVLLRKKYYRTLTLPSNCHKILFDHPHYSLIEQLLLPATLSALHVDLLYTLHFNAPILSPIPRVITLHDLIKSYYRSQATTTHSPWLFKLKRLGYNLVLKRAATTARGIIVPSNTVKNQILASFPTVKPELIHPIPEAPDPIFTNPHNLELENFRFEIPNKYLLFVGNAYPHKNLSVLLEAFRALKDPSLHLLIVSKLSPFLSRTLAPYEPKNLHIFSELSDLELAHLYHHARALVTPSLMEGYGLVGLEALMLGVPVVASNIPVYREVYGDRVTYFDPQSSLSLVKALTEVLNQKRPKPLILKRTWDDVAHSVAEVIHESCASLRPTQ